MQHLSSVKYGCQCMGPMITRGVGLRKVGTVFALSNFTELNQLMKIFKVSIDNLEVLYKMIFKNAIMLD